MISGGWVLHNKRDAKCLAAMDEILGGFYEEWESIHYALFPTVRDDQGKVGDGQWVILGAEPKSYQETLTKHFLGGSSGKLSFVGSGFKFGELLIWVVKHLLATGYCFLLTKWQQGPSIADSAISLPVSPRIIDPTNLLLIRRPGMAPFTLIRSTQKKHWCRLASDESISILRLRHRPPAITAWPFLKDIANYSESGSLRAQGLAQPDNREIAVERARFISERELWRRYVMAKFRVAHVFRTVPNSVLVSSQAVTQYYDGYIRYVHAREILALRGLVVQALNETLMKELRARNQQKLTATFSVRTSKVNPDALWSDYKDGKIDLMELSNQLNSV